MTNPERGLRFALARRLLAAFEGQDVPAPALALRLAKDKKQVYRYERGDDRAPEETVDALVSLCRTAGLPITAEWLERGVGELRQVTIPESVLKPAAIRGGQGAAPPEMPFRKAAQQKDRPVGRPRKKPVQRKKGSG